MNDKIELIIEDYKNRNIKVRNILDKYNLTQRQLNNIINTNGIESRRKVISEEDKKLIKEKYLNRIPIKDIAKEHGLRRESIWQILNRLGVDTSRNSVISENIETIKQLYNEGYSINDIAIKLNIKYKNLLSGMYRFIKGNRLIKVDDQTLNNILKDIEKENIKQCEIAKKYNVSTAYVSVAKSKVIK